MKSNFVCSIVALVAGVFLGNFLSQRRASQQVDTPGGSRGVRATRESALEKSASTRGAAASAGTPVQTAATTSNATREIVARLAKLKVDPNQPRTVRQLIVELEKLREGGPAALPAIREFLARGDDVDYDASLARSPRGGKMPTEFAVPPSLRLGLLEVARSIGGEAGEQVLLETLRTTGRGVEVAYAAAALQELAPEKYRDASLAAARDLLGMPLASKATNVLDRGDRDFLYGVLASFGDRGHIERAKVDVVQPTGRVDPAALRYLQHTLGEQAVTVAAQTWRDPRLAPNEKEPLARLALNYVGANSDALQLWQLAINDPLMPPDARKNLIEDLNQDGFSNPKKLGAIDLPLIQQRITLIEQLLPRTTDPVNIAAFKEAHKDLVNMRTKLTVPSSKP